MAEGHIAVAELGEGCHGDVAWQPFSSHRLRWLGAVLIIAGCRLKSELYVDAQTRPQLFQKIAVVPSSGSRFDRQIAQRVWDDLRKAGVSVVDPTALTPSPQIAVSSVCKQSTEQGFQGVVLVDWNRLTLINCESQLTAFQVAGSDMNAPGVDRLTGILVRYLRGENLK